MRAWAVVFGMGLGILWLVGLNVTPSAPWFTWMHGVAAVCAFLLAGAMRTTGSAVGGTFALSVGLFALWIVGMSMNSPAWQNGWTFAFGCCFAVMGFYGARQAATLPTRVLTHTETDEEKRFRKGA